MDNSMKKKVAQLGMPLGTASNRLKKMLMFALLVEVGKNLCFRCGQPIAVVSDLSVEHKVPWLDSTDPVGLFFELSNVTFSHLACNIGQTRQPFKYPTEEARLEAQRAVNRKAQQKHYTPDKRRQKYLKHGY